MKKNEPVMSMDGKTITHPEFLEAVRAVQAIFKGANITTFPPEFQADIDRDDDGNDLPAMYVEAWTLAVEMRPPVIPSGLQDAPVLSIQRTVTVKGCRTMPNGDPGYPDDVDVVPVESFPLADWFNAAKRFVKLFVDDAIDNAVENYGVELHAEEYLEDNPKERHDENTDDRQAQDDQQSKAESGSEEVAEGP